MQSNRILTISLRNFTHFTLQNDNQLLSSTVRTSRLFMNSDQVHEHNRSIAIEKLIEDYGIEEVIAGLSDYCQTKAITTNGKTKEFWHDVAEALEKVIDGWVNE